MKVIKPIEITDSNMTSTIAEPDQLQGEVEWINRTWLYETTHNIYRVDFEEESEVFYCSESLGNVIYLYSNVWDYTGTSFSTATETNGIDGIAIGNGHVYVLSGNTYKIYEYTLAGMYTGVNFNAPNSNGRLPICIGCDGNRLIISYAKLSAAIDDVSFVNFDGSSSYPFYATIGDEVEISGITKSAKGLLLFDSDTSTGSKRFLDFDIKFQGEPDIDEVDVSVIGANDLVRFSDVIYSGNADSSMQQLDDAGVPVDGVPLGIEAILASGHRKYISTVVNSDNPYSGSIKETPTWIDTGPTNKFAVFDESVSSSSIGVSPLVKEITPGELFDSIVGLNISGATAINVMVTDPVEGVVYNHDIDMVDNSQIVSWSTYLWNDFVVNTSFALLDLPLYKNGTIKITFTGAGEISVGTLVTGSAAVLGEANYGSSVQQLSFNRVEEDDFGNVTIIKRPSAKLVNYDVSVMRDNLSYVYGQLEELDGINAVWLGTDDANDLTIVYGYHRDNNIGIDTPTLCKVTIQVRGLI